MMTGIDKQIEEIEELVRKFEPAAMNGRVPEREDFHKICVLMGEVLRWIAAHDDGRMRPKPLGQRQIDGPT